MGWPTFSIAHLSNEKLIDVVNIAEGIGQNNSGRYDPVKEAVVVARSIDSFFVEHYVAGLTSGDVKA